MTPEEQKVIDIICDTLGTTPEECKPEADFRHDLNADSLDVVELIQEVEDETGILIPDEEVENIRTVGQLLSYLSEARTETETETENQKPSGVEETDKP